ncbi:MAG: isoleucine--tRNA ligase [Bacteroidetes bacterium]|nr:isoleucine--tRNA ligase [Bacteroidota bacterium]
MPKKYTEYKNLNFKEISERILNFWKENRIFEKSIENRKNKKNFNFYEGPPSANGAPGIHHALSRTIKDTFCRYKTLKGYKVKRRAGWDAHGLPVELKVEKTLGITKDDVGKTISIEDYNKECKKTVMAFKDQWDDLTKKMGYWTDLDNPYITFNRDYMESVWNLLKKFYDKNLIYKGYTIQPYSPAAGTGLSSHELNMPGCYQNIKDTSIVAQFKVKDTDNDYFLAWTTTPWTLPANSALAVGKNIEYVKISTFNTYTHKPINVILAKDAIPKYFNLEKEIKEGNLKIKENTKVGDKNIEWKILDHYKGSELENLEYEQLLPYVKPEGKAFKVIIGDFITTEDGTGIVHISPTFGADDMKAAQKAGISPVLVKDKTGKEAPIVNTQGKFVNEIIDFAGRFVKEEYELDEVRKQPNYISTDVAIAIKLKKENKAFRVEKYEHSYPHCWRTDKPILYYPLESWFIKTTSYKDKLIELNNTINWVPNSVGSGRFGNWLENLVDWNLSRDRFWGIPLPIWRTKNDDINQIETKCIGSLDELKREVSKSVKKGFMKSDLPKNFDLHRPYVDDIILVSDKGNRMYRETEVIDVWFDSGSMPYAQQHYPFENKDNFEKEYPADLIAEGVDQTRGWFFTLHTIAVMLFDSVAFKNVVVNGLVLDKDGNKMSKRLGNTLEPLKLIEEYGIDVIRWYMVSNSNPWENLKFDVEELVKVRRRFFNTLENIYGFFALYANIDKFLFDKNIPFSEYLESDKWIISKLNSLIKEVENSYDNYNITKASRLIQDFVVDDLSNWYVRLNRKRFWESARTNEDSSKNGYQEKIIAYQTLYTCLINIAKLSAPITPFYCEKLYLDLNSITKIDKYESIHLSDFPNIENEKINLELEERMKLAQIISSLVHSLRKQYRIKVRQPLSKIFIPLKDENQKKAIELVKELILKETNIKNIEYLDKNQNVIKKKIKPNFQNLGKKYGKHMKLITQEISSLSQSDINEMESKGYLDLKLDSTELQSASLKYEDVIISSEDIPGMVVASDKTITIALDISINDELKKEGIAREFINRIQNLRKESGFDVQDRINLKIKKSSQEIDDAILKHKDYICKETLTSSLNLVDILKNEQTIDIDSNEIKLLIN